MSITTINTLLDTKLATVPNLPSLKLENQRHGIKAGEVFSRATLLPRQSVSEAGQNGRTELGGLYQVDLFYKQNTGTAEANAMADAVVNAFKDALFLSGSGVTVQIQQAWRDKAYTYENYYCVPVMVRWVSFN